MEKNDWVDVASSLLLVAISLLLAWWMEWSATDLMWSVWLSSLVTGWLIIIPSFFISIGSKQAEEKQPSKRKKTTAIPVTSQYPQPDFRAQPAPFVILKVISLLLSTVFGLLGMLFILFHFTAFHILHAFFLNAMFPLFDLKETSFPTNFSEFNQYYFSVIKEYLLFLPLALWTVRHKLFNRNVSPFSPYLGVVKMHLFIMIFGIFFFMASSPDGFAVYVVVYTVFFFPWSLVGKLRKKRKEESVEVQAGKRKPSR